MSSWSRRLDGPKPLSATSHTEPSQVAGDGRHAEPLDSIPHIRLPYPDVRSQGVAGQDVNEPDIVHENRTYKIYGCTNSVLDRLRRSEGWTDVSSNRFA